MWNSTLVKVLRWILFIPNILIGLAVTQWALAYGFKYIIDTTWNLPNIIRNGFFLLFGSITITMAFSALITFLVTSICPNKKIGGVIFSTLVGLNFIYMIYNIWTDAAFNSYASVGELIVCTLLAVVVAGYIINAVFMISDD
jgi:hypothetical protein